MPKVSVVIAVYNGARYIHRAINAALKQTYADLDIVVVDDASTDDTEKIVRKMRSDVPITYLRNDKNQERCLSRNIGAHAATGEYIFFLDYDDEWQPTYVAESLNVFDREGADVVCSILRSKIDTESKLIYTSKKKLSADASALLFSALIGGTPGTAFRKSTFPEYRNEFLFREDWEIVLRAASMGLKISVVDNDTVLVREHHHRTSTTEPRYYAATMRVYESYRDSVPLPYRALFDFEIGSTCLRHGNLLRGWWLCLSAMRRRADLFADGRQWWLLLKRGFRLDRWLNPALRRVSRSKVN